MFKADREPTTTELLRNAANKIESLERKLHEQTRNNIKLKKRILAFFCDEEEEVSHNAFYHDFNLVDKLREKAEALGKEKP